MLVAVDVGEARKSAHLVDDFGRPLIQILNVVALERVLVEGVAGAGAGTEILRRLQGAGTAPGTCRWSDGEGD